MRICSLVLTSVMLLSLGIAAKAQEIDPLVLFLLHYADLEPPTQDERWFIDQARLVREVDLDSFVPNQPFGVPSPVLKGNTIRGGQFSVTSQNSKVTLRDNSFVLPSQSAVMCWGNNGPDFGQLHEPGNNSIVGAGQFNFISMCAVPIPALGNLWDFKADPRAIEDVIFDDDENSSSGLVDFRGFLTQQPFMAVHKGNLVQDRIINQKDFLSLMLSWHTILGQDSFSKPVDFDRNRLLDYRDLFHLSLQYRKRGIE